LLTFGFLFFGPFFSQSCPSYYPSPSYLADLQSWPNLPSNSHPPLQLPTHPFYRFLAKLICFDKKSLFSWLYILTKKIVFLWLNFYFLTKPLYFLAEFFIFHWLKLLPLDNIILLLDKFFTFQ
jgi:hypothetical protein